MFGLLLAVLGIVALIIAGSLQISDFVLRHILIGCLSCASLVSMFASPLFVIVRTSDTRLILLRGRVDLIARILLQYTYLDID